MRTDVQNDSRVLQGTQLTNNILNVQYFPCFGSN